MNQYSQNKNKALLYSRYSKHLQILLEMNQKNRYKNLVQRLLKINSENKAKQIKQHLINN